MRRGYTVRSWGPRGRLRRNIPPLMIYTPPNLAVLLRTAPCGPTFSVFSAPPRRVYVSRSHLAIFPIPATICAQDPPPPSLHIRRQLSSSTHGIDPPPPRVPGTINADSMTKTLHSPFLLRPATPGSPCTAAICVLYAR